MKKFLMSIMAMLLIGLTNLSAAIVAADLPTPSYTVIELAAISGFGIALTVGLLKKAKSFFR